MDPSRYSWGTCTTLGKEPVTDRPLPNLPKKTRNMLGYREGQMACVATIVQALALLLLQGLVIASEWKRAQFSRMLQNRGPFPEAPVEEEWRAQCVGHVLFMLAGLLMVGGWGWALATRSFCKMITLILLNGLLAGHAALVGGEPSNSPSTYRNVGSIMQDPSVRFARFLPMYHTLTTIILTTVTWGLIAVVVALYLRTREQSPDRQVEFEYVDLFGALLGMAAVCLLLLAFQSGAFLVASKSGFNYSQLGVTLLLTAVVPIVGYLHYNRPCLLHRIVFVVVLVLTLGYLSTTIALATRRSTSEIKLTDPATKSVFIYAIGSMTACTALITVEWFFPRASVEETEPQSCRSSMNMSV
ncbi:hypothetical protein H4R33_001535 [Dimargaris cristalligena]|uniref:Uncharacterized protein n=2 Tax=Zoopagomycota TaxID=1913638 RepID=A0A4P9ZZI6_9FUNG|nr:hypothetical protein H4R33_001535 [Dimargaris cristalligena]RKP24127.1 hypothetical protein SYNPS1DRAFT_30105 [Syncephalis pseudoplumigaleata]RKP39196.1 hypothetical protein BJ085DRAFT_37975 [Dimargaris cristalligena]|eukprot:RKP24127.1 hypothetical protein SYNPS1DRAFT_30105 [Syncephalis pseudoplumigaleata]